MGKKETATFLTKRNIALVVVGVAVLAAIIGGIIWWVLSHQVKPSNEPMSASESAKVKAAAASKQATTDGQLRDQAVQAIKANNPTDAGKVYQQAIDSAPSVERKTQLYIDLSEVYYSQGRYDDAFAAAEKANAINPDKFLYADWVSRLYKDRKDYVSAAKYYRLAGQWATSPQNVYALDKAYYDAKAAEMDAAARGGQ